MSDGIAVNRLPNSFFILGNCFMLFKGRNTRKVLTAFSGRLGMGVISVIPLRTTAKSSQFHVS